MELNIKKIREIMKSQGEMSTTELACKMKVSEAWVYGILAGTQGKTFKTVAKLAKALNVNEKDLVVGE